MLQRNSKRPLIGGHGWKDYAQNGLHLEYMLHRAPGDHNLGVVTGTPSKLVIVDVEPNERTPDWVVPTFTVATARGGLHLYYEKPEGIKIGRYIKPGDQGFDLLGDGGYCVGAGSVIGPHGYTVIDKRDAVRLPEDAIRVTLLQRSSSKSIVRRSFKGGKLDIDNVPWLSAGERNDWFTRAAGKNLRAGKPIEEALAECFEVERTKTDRSGTWGGQTEVRRVVEGVYQRYARP